MVGCLETDGSARKLPRRANSAGFSGYLRLVHLHAESQPIDVVVGHLRRDGLTRADGTRGRRIGADAAVLRDRPTGKDSIDPHEPPLRGIGIHLRRAKLSCA